MAWYLVKHWDRLDELDLSFRHGKNESRIPCQGSKRASGSKLRHWAITAHIYLIQI